MAITDFMLRISRGSRTLAWLLGANAAMAIVILIVSLCGMAFGFEGAGLMRSALCVWPHPANLLTHPWSPASYMFVHFSPLHLLFNMMWLYWFGVMLVEIGKDRTLLKLYFGGGIAGAACYILFSLLPLGAGGAGCLAGASAAVLSLITGAALTMPRRRLNFFLLGSVELRWVAVGCIALAAIGGIGAGAPLQAAHFGGVLWAVGALYIPSVRTRRSSRRSERRINAQATVRAINSRVPDEVRLDQLLDKVRISGYDSLSAKEKAELNYISARIK